MKKIILVALLTVSVSSTASMSAHANDGSGLNASLESGVKVYRGAPVQINHQAAANYKALELQEAQIRNQNRLAQAQLNSQNSLAQGRLDLDRRIAFTDNEIFSQTRNRRRFVTRGFGNRFFGINGISRNSRFGRGFGNSPRRGK